MFDQSVIRRLNGIAFNYSSYLTIRSCKLKTMLVIQKEQKIGTYDRWETVRSSRHYHPHRCIICAKPQI